MRSTRTIFLAVLFLAAFGLIQEAAGERLVLAQGGNLLENPSFEGAVYTFVPDEYSWLALYPSQHEDCKLDNGVYMPCNTAQTPVGWIPWWISQSDADPEWKNRMPEYKPADPPFTNRIHSGNRAAQYFTFHGTHTAGLLQVVDVPANARLRFSIWGQAWSSASDETFSDFPTTVNMRIGIDPTGGTNPYSPAIVWSDYKQPYDAYVQFSVEAQAQGTSVTVFTISSPDEARKHNDIYWDDAELVVTGAGAAAAPTTAAVATTTGGAPAATTVAVAAAPAAQLGPTSTPDAEGVIYAEVGPGDSFWSIAARHGLTLEQIYELNDAEPGDFVQEGELLIVGRVTPTVEPTEEAAAAEDEESTPERTPTPQRPTPTPTPQKGEICLKAFVDENRNGLHDPDEPLKPAVAFTISSGDSVFSNYVTTGTDEPYCITGLDPGSYKITRSVTPDEVLTTNGDWSVSLASGTSQQFDFGSYEDEAVALGSSEAGTDSGAAASTAQDAAAAEPEGGITRILVIAAVVVAVLLLVGVLVVVLSARRAV